MNPQLVLLMIMSFSPLGASIYLLTRVLFSPGSVLPGQTSVKDKYPVSPPLPGVSQYCP